jgi:hypothetical protein
MTKKIFRLLKKYWLLVTAFVASFLMFLPSLSAFYTHDDFYFLKIAKVSSLEGFLNFFNLVKDTEGIGVYRPLTLRVYYFLGSGIFNLNPISMHIISFITFFVVILLVLKLVRLLTGNDKIAVLSSFLYAVSVTHFGQLYYIGAFQELFLTMVFLGSVIFFVKYEIDSSKKHSSRNIILSFLLFLLSLMSKETAVVLPVVLLLTHYYLKIIGKVKTNLRKLAILLFPYFGVLARRFLYLGLLTSEGHKYIRLVFLVVA